MIVVLLRENGTTGQTKKIYRYNIKSSSQNRVALLSKNSVVLCNDKDEKLVSIKERMQVKSGAWDGDDVFLYTTKTHIKVNNMLSFSKFLYLSSFCY